MPTPTTEDTNVHEPEVIYHQPNDERPPTTSRREQMMEKTATAIRKDGSSIERFCALGTVVLTILAFCGVATFALTALATIAIGVALLVRGLAATAAWNDSVARLGEQGERVQVGGLRSEVIGGATGTALGILGLVGVLPAVLLPVAAIVYGGSILMAGAHQRDLARFEREPDRNVDRTKYQGIQASSGNMTLAGAAAAVLGIIGLVTTGGAFVLTAVAMLVVAGALLLSDRTVTARFTRKWHSRDTFRRSHPASP
jgi:hypothetical protein